VVLNDFLPLARRVRTDTTRKFEVFSVKFASEAIARWGIVLGQHPRVTGHTRAVAAGQADDTRQTMTLPAAALFLPLTPNGIMATFMTTSRRERLVGFQNIRIPLRRCFPLPESEYSLHGTRVNIHAN